MVFSPKGKFSLDKTAYLLFGTPCTQKIQLFYLFGPSSSWFYDIISTALSITYLITHSYITLRRINIIPNLEVEPDEPDPPDRDRRAGQHEARG